MVDKSNNPGGWAIGAPPANPKPALLANPVLASLSADAVRRIAGCFAIEQVPAGGPVFGAGQPDTLVIVGVGGRLRVRPEEPYPTLSVFRYQGSVIAPWQWAPTRWPGSQIPQLDVIADVDSQILRADLKQLRALESESSMWGKWGFARFLELLFLEGVLSVAPDLAGLTAQQRLELAEMFDPVPRSVPTGRVLFDYGQTPDGLYAALYGSRFGITSRTGPSAPAKAPISITGAQVLGIGSLGALPGIQVRAVATAPSEIFVIPIETLHKMLRRHPDGWLARAAAHMLAVSNAIGPVFAALSQHPLFATTTAETLFAIVRGGTLRNWAVGAHAPAPFGSVPGIGVLVEGEIAALLYDSGQSGLDVRVLGGYDPVGMVHRATPTVASVFGLDHELVSYIEGPADYTKIPFVRWRARRPSTALFLPRHQLIAHLSHGPNKAPSQAALDKLGRELEATLATRKVANAGDKTQVLTRSIESAMDMLVAIPVTQNDCNDAVDALLLQAGAAIAADFEESCVFLRVFREGPDEAAPSVAWAEDGVTCARCRLKQSATTIDAVGQIRDAIAPGGVLHRGGQINSAHRTVVIVRLPAVPGANREDTFRAELLRSADGMIPVSADADWPMPLEMPSDVPLHYVAMLPGAAVRGLVPPTAAIRLRVNQQAAAGWTLADGPPTGSRAVLQPVSARRLARGLTHRRVGVALGGGGAWGMAHIAMIQGLTMHEIPVDLISGASVGSTVGAYFSAEGSDGLHKLSAARKRLQVGMYVGAITLRLFENQVNKDLGHRRLEDLELPFFPVATDLLVSSPAPILEGTLGLAVRKSGSMPPFYSPTMTKTASYADGGFSSNLPVNTLRVEGARLLVASNIVPPAPIQLPADTSGPLRRVRRVLSELSPIKRAEASVRAAITLFESGGAQSAADAPIYFDEGWTGTMPWALELGPEIIESTLAQPHFWDMLQGARARWEYLKGPRSGLDSPTS